MKELIIYHHLGLGDHIICNGLVREIIKKNQYKFYKLIVKNHNIFSVEFMYRDIENLSFISVKDDFEADQFILKSNIPYIKVGFKSPPENITWDQLFYVEANIDFNKRWDSFYVKRDILSEEKLFNKLNPKRESYILVHTLGSTNRDGIDYSVLNKSLKTIFVEKYTDVIFDYMNLIENATQIHCISSSFQTIVDSMNIDIPVFYHNKINNNIPQKFKLNWILV
jgi:hypothetical protein